MMNKFFFALLVVMVANAAFGSATDEVNETEAARVKRGGGYGGGGGGGGGGHGHGPGRGGGAAGPVYFCGYIGKTEGYGGYGR